MNSLYKVTSPIIFSLLCAAASAQVTLSTFSSLDQVFAQQGGASVNQNLGTQSVTLLSLSELFYSLPNLDLTGLNSGNPLALTLSKAAGNTSNTLVVLLFDSNLDPIVGGQFEFDLTSVPTDSFTTLQLALPEGSSLLGLGSVPFFRISGSPIPTAFTSVTLDNLALVPEPATYGIAAGALALGLVILRRRRSA